MSLKKKTESQKAYMPLNKKGSRKARPSVSLVNSKRLFKPNSDPSEFGKLIFSEANNRDV